jgi:hypothetical protein
MNEPGHDEIFLRWRVATDRYNELDRRLRAAQQELSELWERAAALVENRDRTPREIIEEARSARLTSLKQAESAEIQQVRDDAARRISEIEEEATRRIREIRDAYRPQAEAVKSEFESQLAPLRGDGDGDDDEELDPWEDFSSPEYDAIREEAAATREMISELKRLRIEARKELGKARDAKLAVQRSR